MRLIDADALMRDIEKYHLSEGKFQHWVEVQPTIEERKTGEWIEKTEVVDCSTFHGRRCSLCGCWVGMGRPNFCPNCGADMRGGQDG